MDWNMFGSAAIGAMLGGFFTLLGGQYQVYLSAKNEKKENTKNMKIKLLEKMMANKAAISDAPSKLLYEKDFYNSLNQISITFSDNEKVIEIYEKFWRNSNLEEKQQDSTELLYDLIKEMYQDLSGYKDMNITAPSFEVFTRTFY